MALAVIAATSQAVCVAQVMTSPPDGKGQSGFTAVVRSKKMAASNCSGSRASK
jgi:hypothetical protein